MLLHYIQQDYHFQNYLIWEHNFLIHHYIHQYIDTVHFSIQSEVYVNISSNNYLYQILYKHTEFLQQYILVYKYKDHLSIKNQEYFYIYINQHINNWNLYHIYLQDIDNLLLEPKFFNQDKLSIHFHYLMFHLDKHKINRMYSIFYHFDKEHKAYKQFLVEKYFKDNFYD